MKTKKYEKPQIEVVAVNTKALMAASISQCTEGGEIKNVENMVPESKGSHGGIFDNVIGSGDEEEEE